MAFLSGPKDCLTSLVPRDNFCMQDVECGDFVTTPVFNVVLHIHYLDMCLAIKAGEVFNCELAQSCSHEEGGS